MLRLLAMLIINWVGWCSRSLDVFIIIETYWHQIRTLKSKLLRTLIHYSARAQMIVLRGGFTLCTCTSSSRLKILLFGVWLKAWCAT